MWYGTILSRRNPLRIPPPQFRVSCQCVGSLVSYNSLSHSTVVRLHFPFIRVCTSVSRLPRCLFTGTGHQSKWRCSQAGTSNAKTAGAILLHGTMRRSSSRAVSRRRLHHPTARHEGGLAALSCCPGRPVPSLNQEFELRSCRRRARCPPSRGACATPSR